jgi:putative aldouronate transport system permease protein
MVKARFLTRNRIRKKAKEQAALVMIYLFLVLFALICLFPFLNVFSKSISNEASVLSGEIVLLPIGVHWNSYRYVLAQPQFLASFVNTVFVTLVGTALALLLTSMTGFALCKKRFRESKLITLLYVFTMIFSAGLIPGYLVVRSLGLYDTLWGLILLSLHNPFNLMIMRSFMGGIPDSIEDAAMIDGAGHFQTLFHIILPISKPVLASLGLFFAVGIWNDFFRPLIYIMSTEKYTLQLYLRSILINVNDVQNTLDPLVYGNVAPQSVQNATIIVSIIPILLVYPFLQRYFTAGITLGAVKG